MLASKKKSRLFFIIIISCFPFTNVFSQNLLEVNAYAQNMQKAGRFDEAVLAYQRVIFFDKEKLFLEDNYKNIGLCYLELSDYEKASNYFDLAYFNSNNDSIKTELIFKKAFCQIKTQQYLYAQLELLNLPDSLSTENQNRLCFYNGVSFYGQKKFKDSEQSFLETVNDSLYKDSIQYLFKKVYKTEKINPKTSKLLSTIIPGLGQYYNGDFYNGTNSLLLLSGFGYLAYTTAINYGFFDAVVSVLPWYQRYYMGGYTRAEEIAIKRKQEKLADLELKIMDAISQSKTKNLFLNTILSQSKVQISLNNL